MKWISWMLFPVRFAFIDLYGRRSFWVTLTNLFNVLLLVALVVVVYGLILGTNQRQIEALRNDPLAGCQIYLPLGDEATIRSEKRDELLALIAEKIYPTRLRGVHLFSPVLRDFALARTPGSEVKLRNRLGRTFSADDPLFGSFSRAEDWFAGGPPDPTNPGLVIDRPMLKLLGYKVPPATLEVQTQNGLVPVKLAGVLKTDLPGQYSFLMPESIRDHLREKDVVVRIRSYGTGPLPLAWHHLPRPPFDVERFLGTKDIQFIRSLDLNPRLGWLLESIQIGGFPLREDWMLTLDEIARRMERRWRAFLTADMVSVSNQGPLALIQPRFCPVDDPARQAFRNGDVRDFVEDGRVPDKGHQRMAVYLLHPDDFNTTSALCEANALTLQDDRYEQLRRFSQATKRALDALGYVLYALAVLMFFNMVTIQSLQAQRKRAEMGMLKAMGMTWPGLFWICFWEGILLWLPALLVGIAAHWYLGPFVASLLAANSPDAPLAFDIPLQDFLWISGLSLGMCFLSTLWAVWLPLSRSPLACLTEV